METTPMPIQVISLWNSDGGMSPLRFRFEDEAHELHTVHIAQVMSVQPVTYVGIEAFRFLCRSEEMGTAHLYELCYTVRSHRWDLQRKIY